MTKNEEENITPPETPAPTQTTPARSPGWRIWLLTTIIVLMLGLMYLWARTNPQSGLTSRTSPGAASVRPPAAAPGRTLNLTWRLLTNGPSPFSPGIWVARIELGATGGNDEYIFWVNGQRLPEANNRQFTVESQGCQPISQFVGVTSDGQSARQELVIYPPESSSCPR